MYFFKPKQRSPVNDDWPNMAAPSLSLALLKSLLRSARKLDRLVPAAHISGELARFPEALSVAAPAPCGRAFAEAVKSAFRVHSASPSSAAALGGLHDSALRALAAANARVADLSAPKAAPSAAPPAIKPAGVLYSVGQVIRHSVHGYL